jgi:PAS domain S-box-containing protein
VHWGEGPFEALLDLCDDAVLCHDRAGRLVRWNRSAERIFGYPAGEVLGERLSTLLPEHLRDELEAMLSTMQAGDHLRHFETEVVRKDGMPVPISLSVCPVLEADPHAVASVAIARDLTEQRLAQATFAEIETRVRESEAMAHVGSWLWDVRTGAVQWSDEFHRIHGVDPLEFEGTFAAHLDRVHPDDRERVVQELRESVAASRPFEAEYRVVRPSGAVRSLRARAQPTIGSDGTVTGLRGIGQDVTDGR